MFITRREELFEIKNEYFITLDNNERKLKLGIKFLTII